MRSPGSTARVEALRASWGVYLRLDQLELALQAITAHRERGRHDAGACRELEQALERTIHNIRSAT